MRETNTPRTIIENAATAGVGRSEVFLWFVRNYPQFLPVASAKRIDWKQMAEDLGEAGIRNTLGHRPSPHLVKTTWFRVRRHMRGRSVCLADEGPNPIAPDRIPTDLPQSKTTGRWLPARSDLTATEKASNNFAMPLAPLPATVAPTPAAEPPPERSRGQAELERVRAELKERSDRRNGIF